MIKLKNILEEYKYRSKRISKHKNNFLLDKFYGNKKDAIENNTTSIYRGVKDRNFNYLYVQPSKYTRKTEDTANYYTLIIDNSKYWKEYPKRSKSIICTGDKKRASDYGTAYRVFPKYNTKIGICPEDDIWFSFKKGLEVLGKFFYEKIYNLVDFNTFLRNKFSLYAIKSNKMLMQKINEYELSSEQKQMLKKYNCKTLFEFIDYCLNPELNGFELVKFNENFKIDEINRKEIWTDADSLLISLNTQAIIFSCINYDDIKSIKKIISAPNYRINQTNKNGSTPLIHACIYEKLEIVKLLLSHPYINVNIQDNFDETALIHACWNNNTEIVKLLLQRKDIDVNIQNKYGNTALIYACRFNRIEIVKLLLNNPNVDTSIKNKNGRTAIDYAKDNKIIKLLKRHGAK